jgi:hypothetical protein
VILPCGVHWHLCLANTSAQHGIVLVQ